jgi:siderophore ferric iron reductase
MRFDSNELVRLVETANHALPRMAGKVGSAVDGQLVCGSADNPQRIAALCAHWQQAHPEAGAHYWNIRSWTLLIWQPIYLSLLAVHLTGAAPCLAKMGQSMCDGLVGGFCLPEHCPRQGDQVQVIPYAAQQINEFVEQQLGEFNSVATIYPKMARLLAVDCVRAALLMAQRCLAMGNGQLRDLEGQWLNALALPAASSLIAVQLDDGRECLALERKVCCQHFRRGDGELCSTCPKLKQLERLVRLRAEFSLAC